MFRKTLFSLLALTALIVLVLPSWRRGVVNFELGTYQYLAYAICLILPFVISILKKVKGKNFFIFSFASSILGFYSSVTIFTIFCMVNKTNPEQSSEVYLALVVLLVTYFSFELPWFLRAISPKNANK